MASAAAHTSARTHEGEGADPREGTRDCGSPREGTAQDPKGAMETVATTTEVAAGSTRANASTPSARQTAVKVTAKSFGTSGVTKLIAAYAAAIILWKDVSG